VGSFVRSVSAFVTDEALAHAAGVTSAAPQAHEEPCGTRQRVAAHLRPVLRLERPFLHSMRLAFTHPIETERRIVCVAPLPADLQSVLDDVVGKLEEQE
jgi:hypothetical protein